MIAGQVNIHRKAGFWVGQERRCLVCASIPVGGISADFADLKQRAEIVAPSVVVSDGDFGRGLLFKADCPEGAVVSIPFKNVLLITDDPVESQSIVGERHIQKHQDCHGNMPLSLCEFLIGDASWDARLCAWLLYIMKKYSEQQDGMWPEYIKSLPLASDLNLLLTFSPMEQMLLKIPRYRATAQLGRDAVERLHYSYFFGRDAELGDLRLSDSFEHTLYAMALVRSRTFGLTIAAEPVSVMAPFLDLANHRDPFACSFRASDDELSLELVAFEGHRAGQELFITYGQNKGALDFLRDYGFVDPGSPGRIHFASDAKHILDRLSDRDRGLELAAQAVKSAQSYFADEVTDGETPAKCREACMQPSTEPRLSFGLLFLSVGSEGSHSDILPFKVRMKSAAAAAAVASLTLLIASVPGDCTAAVAETLARKDTQFSNRSAFLDSCSPEALASQRALCASLQQLLKVVWEHVEEKRTMAEVAEAYQVSMSRVQVARSAQVEYLAVLEQMDLVLTCFDQFLEGHERPVHADAE